MKIDSSTSKTSQNGSGVPQWLEDLGVEKGGWYCSSKARPKRLMKTSLTGEAQRVYACLELATMAFQQELAVKMDKGRRVPLTQADISEQTALSKQHVNRGLKELEGRGLAERRPINGQERAKGNVAIYSWAAPRPDKVENGSRARLPFWETLEPEFAPLEAFASRWKIIPAKNIVVARDDLSRAMVAAAEAEEAVKVAVAIVKGILAPSRIYKVEINGNKPETNGAGRQASTVDAEITEKTEANGLPACPPPVENQNGNATPGITTGEQILELPEVQQLQVETGDAIGLTFASTIAVNLRDAPIEKFVEAITARKKKGFITPGLLPTLAASVARSNDIRKQRAQAERSADAWLQKAQQSSLVKQLLRDWDKVPKADRQAARETWTEIDWPPE